MKKYLKEYVEQIDKLLEGNIDDIDREIEKNKKQVGYISFYSFYCFSFRH